MLSDKYFSQKNGWSDSAVLHQRLSEVFLPHISTKTLHYFVLRTNSYGPHDLDLTEIKQPGSMFSVQFNRTFSHQPMNFAVIVV